MDGIKEAIANLRWRVEELERGHNTKKEPLPSGMASFINYCYEHPEQRFWQALRNWSGHNYILVADAIGVDDDGGKYIKRIARAQDTFNWTGKNGHDI